MPKLPSYRKQPIDLLGNQLTGFYMMATLAFNELIFTPLKRINATDETSKLVSLVENKKTLH